MPSETFQVMGHGWNLRLPKPKRLWFLPALIIVLACTQILPISNGHAQDSFRVQEGAGLPREINEIYARGSAFLISNQQSSGQWPCSQGTVGVTALATMALLATGEDPNFGKYAPNIRAGLRFVIRKQNSKTGYLGQSMYEHGFAMLVLSEAYGMVDEDLLWSDAKGGSRMSERSIGETLEQAVRLAIKAQQGNPLKAWRYMPTSRDADVSIVGAVMVGLLAAKNAGITVPDDTIAGGLAYLRTQTDATTGDVSYSGPASLEKPLARAAIVTLVHSIAGKTESSEFAAVKSYITNHESADEPRWPFYERYYLAQALFQSDYNAWQNWNQKTIQTIRRSQDRNGKIGNSTYGDAYSTSMSMLALALNHRFLPIYER